MSELDEQIDEILINYDNYTLIDYKLPKKLLEQGVTPAVHLQFNLEAKQAIKALIANQVREAKIDELNQVMGNLHDNRDCTTCYTNHQKLEKHYRELKGDDK